MKNFLLRVTTCIVALFVYGLNSLAHAEAGRTNFTELIGKAVKDPVEACEISRVNVRNLYSSFENLVKKDLATSDDRALYYLICGDAIKKDNPPKYHELFGSLTTVQKAAPVMRAVLAALKHPKVSCFGLGIFGQELGNLSDTTRALICQACVNTNIPDSQGRSGRGMFEQTGDWKAIIAVCGKDGAKKICNQGYLESFADQDYRKSLVSACAEAGKAIKK